MIACRFKCLKNYMKDYIIGNALMSSIYIFDIEPQKAEKQSFFKDEFKHRKS